MKIALDWIADYLSRPLAPAEAETALINAGLPLESNEPFADAGGATHVLDVEVTSNRTDCLSHVGLARELAALLGLSLRIPPAAIPESGPDVSTLTAVQVDDAVGCPYYSARLLTGVKVGPSPDWLVHRLAALGLRSINNVVDITNYVLMELGQPLHAFDFNLLQGRCIIVRRAAAGEKITAIDARTYPLDPSMLVIADASRPVAVAGVMGGKDTEVTASTTAVLLESARFDPLVIRSQARALALMSDSSYRFERGLDPALAEYASRRAAALILHLCGGQLATGVLAVGSTQPRHLAVELRLRRLAEVLGIQVPAARTLEILTALGFAPQPSADGQTLRCTVPSHRLDIDREIDLIEEVARVHGYQHITPHDRVSHPVQPEPVTEKAGRILRQALTAAGFSEAITVSFIPHAEAAAFLPTGSHGDHAGCHGDAAGCHGEPTGCHGDAVLSARHAHSHEIPARSIIPLAHKAWQTEALRPSLFPSLLAVRRTNQNVGLPNAWVFEHAEVFWQTGGEGGAKTTPPTQHRTLTLLADSVAAVRGAIELALSRMSAHASLIVRPKDFPWFAPGVAAELILVKANPAAPGAAKLSAPAANSSARSTDTPPETPAEPPLGTLGLFSTDVQKKYDLRHPVAGAELSWDALLAAFDPVRRAEPLPRFPAISRDLSLVLAESIRWSDLHSTLTAAALPFLESITFVGTFRNPQIGPGKKSLTLTLEFRDPNTTLRAEQADAQMKTALDLLTSQFGATLRA